MLNEFEPSIGLQQLIRNAERFLTVQDLMLQNVDHMVRVQAAALSSHSNAEFYPMLRSTNSFKKNSRKSTIVQIVFENIPQPLPDTPWENRRADHRRDLQAVQYLSKGVTLWFFLGGRDISFIL